MVVRREQVGLLSNYETSKTSSCSQAESTYCNQKELGSTSLPSSSPSL